MDIIERITDTSKYNVYLYYMDSENEQWVVLGWYLSRLRAKALLKTWQHKQTQPVVMDLHRDDMELCDYTFHKDAIFGLNEVQWHHYKPYIMRSATVKRAERKAKAAKKQTEKADAERRKRVKHHARSVEVNKWLKVLKESEQ